MVSGAEGITGFISEVTLRVMTQEPLSIVGVRCPDAVSLASLLDGVVAAKLPNRSLGFVDPAMIRLTNRCPPRAHPREDNVEMPVCYLVMLAMRAADVETTAARLNELIKTAHAERLADELARHEWDNRFRIMRVKRLGPSLVPAEVVVPLETLRETLDDLRSKIDQPLVLDGIAIARGANGKPEIVLLGFIPQDERTLGYDLAFGLALSVIKIAEHHGGRAYSTGLYFSAQGARRARSRSARPARTIQARSGSRRRDESGQGDRSRRALDGRARGRGARAGRAVRRQPREERARRAPTWRQARHPRGCRGYAYACSQCGYCVDECDQFYGRGWESQSPRGKCASCASTSSTRRR